MSRVVGAQRNGGDARRPLPVTKVTPKLNPRRRHSTRKSPSIRLRLPGPVKHLPRVNLLRQALNLLPPTIRMAPLLRVPTATTLVTKATPTQACTVTI